MFKYSMYEWALQIIHFSVQLFMNGLQIIRQAFQFVNGFEYSTDSTNFNFRLIKNVCFVRRTLAGNF